MDHERKGWTLQISNALVIEACIVLVCTFLGGVTYGMRRTMEMLEPRFEECIEHAQTVEALMNKACRHDQ